MSYVDLDTEFKPYIKQNAAYSALEDDVLQAAIDAAEAGINEGLQRQIAVVPADDASARTFRVRGDCILRIDDAATVTLVAVDGVTVSASDYQLEPLNHRTRSGQWRPYDQIRSLSTWEGDDFGNVTVTGTWGWTSIPPQVVEACKILAKDILANRDVNFGIAGFAEYGAVRARENPEVWNRVATLRAVEAWGIG